MKSAQKKQKKASNSASNPLVVFFKNLSKNSVNLVGGKGANLGEMVGAGFPVPNGFCVTVEAYERFLEENNLTQKIMDLLGIVNPHNPDELREISARIRKMVKTSPVPKDVQKEVFKAYKSLSGPLSSALVAARSSATAEDMPGTSFAGQQETFLNVKGEANVLLAVRNCWASLFTARSIFYRVENKIPHPKVKISVVIQKMIQSETSGVMFTIDPVSGEKDRIVIEAVWGLGEMIVQGLVIPDRYVVQKETFSILSKEISQQFKQLVRVGGETKEVEVPKKQIDRQKISDSEIVALAKLADGLHKHYYFPQDSEWSKEKNRLYIVQTRPVTAFGEKTPKTKNKDNNLKFSDTPVLTGIPASPGIATGSVKVIKTAKEINKINKGDILVAPMTSPDFVPAMKKAEAIITDQGGQTSHAAIVSRELGIPCIVGTKEATTKLVPNQIVSVDGSKGVVMLGSKLSSSKEKEKTNTPKKTGKVNTSTKIYVNLAEPQRANEISKLNVDGVGLLRAEFMMADIGLHPKEAIKQKKQDKFVKKLASGIAEFCSSFNPRQVVYRASDFKTNEYRMLEGGRKWEPEEPNPLLGFRGAFRYIAWPEVFALELRALKMVQEKYHNLNLMIPFVRSPNELSRVRRLVVAEGLFEKSTFKFWMMVEIPTNVILIDDFIKVGLDGVSIGSNDLTMLVTGTDRDNSEVAEAFDERSPAVMWALKRVIKKCNQAGVTSSICGQAPSFYDDFVDNLVEYGITSISVNPDSIDRVRKVVFEAEKNKARKKG